MSHYGWNPNRVCMVGIRRKPRLRSRHSLGKRMSVKLCVWCDAKSVRMKKWGWCERMELWKVSCHKRLVIYLLVFSDDGCFLWLIPVFPVAYFTGEVKSALAKPPMIFIGGLAVNADWCQLWKLAQVPYFDLFGPLLVVQEPRWGPGNVWEYKVLWLILNL